MPITIYPGSMKKRNANGSYSDLVPAIATDPEVLDDFAEEYSTSETYNIGDYCIHNSDLYKCNTNNTTGTWNNNAWDRVSVADELVDHTNALNQLETNVGKILPVITGSTNNSGYTIVKGDYFEANGALYKATVSIPIDGAWSSSATAQTSTAVNDLKNSFPPMTADRQACANLDAVKTYLNNQASKIANYMFIPVCVESGFQGSGFYSSVYSGILHRVSGATYLSGYLASVSGRFMFFASNNGNWTFYAVNPA